MAGKNPLQKCFLFIILSLNLMSLHAETGQKKTYVVHMDKSAMPSPYTNHLQWYSSKIDSVTDPKSHEEEGNRILYTYQTAFHGLAARLSKEEAARLEEEPGVVAVIPETRYELHTTRSPRFLGLERQESERVWAERVTDHDVVVGVLDTGIWPESESFNDTGMSPVPSTWRGACETGRGFLKHNCNRKIVGARVFYRGYEAATGKIDQELEYRSPRDKDGHGTHTAATVAGSPVRGANLLGFAYGTARGMAPKARVAAYKVCWVGGCFSSDILSAVDQAVADGVHVLSISLGGGISTYSRDSLAIATFGAMEMGVFVSCSAGNGGPDPISLTNVSPWITTVGASTMDRDFPATVRLGTRRVFKGVSLYKGRTVLSRGKQYPLVYLGRNASSPDPTSFCLDGALDQHNVAGKIVICDRGVTPRVQKGQVVKRAGGVGMILTNTATNGEELVADCHLLPAVAVGEKEGKVIKEYAMTSKRATASLEILGTRVGIKPSPVVAAFSSRGPNFLSLEILKPDLLAPGVNILAAWSGDMAPSSLSSDKRRVKFNILSGTSMSCPHVSGVAALIRSRHPDWSPAAVKSALMTTAYVHDNMLEPLTDAAGAEPSSPYDHGAGHIDPLKAIDPGLVYDIGPQEYFDFLCTQELSPSQLKVFTKHSNRSCRHSLAGNNPGNLNYPAISALFPENTHVKAMTLRRTVTNVGPHVSSYKVSVSPFKGATVTVQPKTLNFTTKHQKLSYTVTFRTKLRMKRPEFGGLLWKSATHKVRSPVIITWLPSFPSRLRPPPQSRFRPPHPSRLIPPPQSRLRPPSLPSRLRPPPSRLRPPPSRLRPPPSRLRPPPSRLCPPPSRLRPPPSRLRPPPSRLHLRPLPDPPPCTSPSVPLEARSLLKPPDPPYVPSILVLLMLFDTVSSQLFSKSSDLKSPLLNLVLVFSHGVTSLVYVDDTSFVSKCLSPAVCSVFLYWCIDWGPHRFSPSNFIYPPLKFITLVIVFVDSTMGCSIPIPISISVSLPLPLIQVLSQRFFNLILSDEFISLVWYFELSLNLSLFLALVHPFTAVCSPFTVVCSPFTAVCSSIFVVCKSFYAQWQLNGLMSHISTHHGNLVVYYPVSSFMDFVFLPLSSSTFCGFGVGNVLLKIRDTSNTEVLIKGFVAMLKIVDCALVAASILGIISLTVVSKFQGFASLYSSMIAEIRGLLDIISCLSVLYAPIFLCCICFLVIAVCLAWMVSLLCSYTFSIHGE